MTAEHLFFIPAVLLLGVWLGYSLGVRTARADAAKRERRAKE